MKKKHLKFNLNSTVLFHFLYCRIPACLISVCLLHYGDAYSLLCCLSPDTAKLSSCFSICPLSETALWARKPLHVSSDCWPLTREAIPGCCCACCFTETVTCPVCSWKTLVSLFFFFPPHGAWRLIHYTDLANAWIWKLLHMLTRITFETRAFSDEIWCTWADAMRTQPVTFTDIRWPPSDFIRSSVSSSLPSSSSSSSPWSSAPLNQ